MLRVLLAVASRELKPGGLSPALDCLNDGIAHTCVSVQLVCCSDAASLLFRDNPGRTDFPPSLPISLQKIKWM